MPGIAAMLRVVTSTSVAQLVNACLSATHKSIWYSLKRRAPAHPRLATVCGMIEDRMITQQTAISEVETNIIAVLACNTTVGTRLTKIFYQPERGVSYGIFRYSDYCCAHRQSMGVS